MTPSKWSVGESDRHSALTTTSQAGLFWPTRPPHRRRTDIGGDRNVLEHSSRRFPVPVKLR